MQKDSFRPATEEELTTPSSATAPSFQTTSTPSGGEQVTPKPFREQFPTTTGILDVLSPIIANIGVGMIPGIGGPISSSIGMAVAEQGIKNLTGEVPETDSLSKQIIQTAKNAIVNYSWGKIGEAGIQAFQGFRRLQGTSTVPKTLLKLRPTYAQITGSEFAEGLEDLAVKGLKAEAVANSVKIAQDQVQEMTGRMVGRSQTPLITAATNVSPVKTSKIGFGQLQDLTARMEAKTAADYEKFVTQSRIHAEEARRIGASGLNKNYIITKGPQIGIGPGNKPVFAQVKVAIDGPVKPYELVNKVLQMQKDVGLTMKTPDPDSRLLADLDSILQMVGYVKDPKTGAVTYHDLPFETAWNSKIDYGKVGWEGVTESGKEYKDVNYRMLHDAISKDIERDLPTWAHKGPDALKQYLEANKYVRARHALYEGMPSKVVDLQGLNKPDTRINTIANDYVLLKKFLVSNEYKLSDGSLISSTNKRGDMKAYKFMQMWHDAWTGTRPQDLTAGNLNTDKLIADWNKYKISKEGKTLYNQQDIKNIDEFYENVRKINTDPEGAGTSRYVKLRLATGMLHTSGVIAASILGGGGNLLTSGAAGTLTLAGMALGSKQVGKILVNPDHAVILNKLMSGKPLGRSWQSAMQIIAYGLRNEKVRAIFSNGTEADVQLDREGKPKNTINQPDSFRLQ